MAVLVAVGALGGAGALLRHRDDTPPVAAQPLGPATIELTSTPSGAAIFVGGEPTGLTTPATLSGLTGSRLTIRVELSDYLPASQVFDVAPGSNAHHAFVLRAASGRVALAGLPSGTVIIADGEEHAAGEVITLPVGRHEIRLLLAGRPLVQQAIEVSSGHQVWELGDHELLKK
ncbi:MAG TPA: PEGA domain-containing protein [Kofleriaceae bacterium]|nr:PEGA domain-containing protein [Kofleriaceae bacterium]